MKQAPTTVGTGRAHRVGVGVIVATQTPMELDYRALSNAGAWRIGRLQTGADRTGLLDGFAGVRQKEDESQAALDLEHLGCAPKDEASFGRSDSGRGARGRARRNHPMQTRTTLMPRGLGNC